MLKWHFNQIAFNLNSIIPTFVLFTDNRSIAAIRSASAIKRLVYVSCNPNSAKRNFIELARPESKQYKGEPFYPKCAVAVDMFPHTSHTELVILFERESKSTPTEAATKETAAETETEIATEAAVDCTESVAAPTAWRLRYTFSIITEPQCIIADNLFIKGLSRYALSVSLSLCGCLSRCCHPSGALCPAVATIFIVLNWFNCIYVVPASGLIQRLPI